MSTLRDYQLRAIEMLRANIRNRPLLALPTGAGKTSVAAEIIRSATSKGRRCVFLVHRRELVDQAVDRLAQFDVRAGRILAGHPERLERPVQVASIPTLIRRAHWPAELVIVDECSHAVSESWSKLLARYQESYVIGLTATPIRLDGRGLGDMFGVIVEPVTTAELIERGYLVLPSVFAPPVDLANIRVKRGDYDVPQLAERMNRLVGSLTETWLKRARGMLTVAFAVNIEHSRKIVDAFNAIGVRSAHVDYRMGHVERARTLRHLRERRIDLVSQVQLLTEGWDMPELQCAIIARPTKSLALHRQMIGRVVRPPGPVVVLDHAGNHLEHGLITDEIEWTLDGATRRTSKAPSVRTCKECFAIIPPDAAECPACGAPLPERDVAPPEVDNPGELVAIDLAGAPRRGADMQAKQREYRSLLQVASARGYRLGWARLRYRDQFGTWPRLRELERAEYRCPEHEWEPAQYGPRSVTRCSWCFVERERVAT